MVFNILANNTDDHHKNFTFVMNRQGVWRLSPAYDLTYIFDTGGYLPNNEHCLMIGGKIQNISKEDAIAFAREMGIRAPESIIRKVAAAIASFRTFAQKNGVKNEWIGRVEATITDHLKSWGEIKEECDMSEWSITDMLSPTSISSSSLKATTCYWPPLMAEV